jgi:hypothetical protein
MLGEMDRLSLPIEVEEGLGCRSAMAEAIFLGKTRDQY